MRNTCIHHRVFLRYSSVMTPTTDLGLSIRVSMFEHVDWWLGPLPRFPGMGEGGDWWSWPTPNGVLAEGSSVVCCSVLKFNDDDDCCFYFNRCFSGGFLVLQVFNLQPNQKKTPPGGDVIFWSNCGLACIVGVIIPNKQMGSFFFLSFLGGPT